MTVPPNRQSCLRAAIDRAEALVHPPADARIAAEAIATVHPNRSYGGRGVPFNPHTPTKRVHYGRRIAGGHYRRDQFFNLTLGVNGDPCPF